MDPSVIIASGNSLLHLHLQNIRASHTASPDARLVVSFHVGSPSVFRRGNSYTFSFTALPNAIPYRHWQQTVEHMILTAAGHDAPILNVARLVHDFCEHTHDFLVYFRASPGDVLFLSAVIDVATDPPPRHFYYFPFPRAAVHVAQAFVNPVTPAGYRFDGGTPDSASPIRSTIERVAFGEAAAEGDCEISCPICLEEYEKREVLDELLCGHQFHPHCIVEWLRKRPTCPLCRMQLPHDLE